MNWYQRVALVMLCGALAFGLPTILVHLVSGNSFGIAQVVLLTILNPCVCWLAADRLEKTRLLSFGRREVSRWMLAGIWFLGPILLDFDWSLTSSLMMALWFPVSMWIGANYTGTLGALIIVSAVFGYRAFREV